MMKRFSIAVICLVSFLGLQAQAPGGFKYQAVVRDNMGVLLPSQEVNIQVEILRGTVAGTAVYSESHAVTTSAQGLVTLEIGKGNTSDNFASLPWWEDQFFLRISVNGNEMGTSQLLSVPYALVAQSALDFRGDELKNIKDPVDDQDVATKAYVDRQITNPGIRINASIDSVICYGDIDGAIDLNITGGSAPYLFEWDNGATTEDLSGLTRGKYQVYVEDATGMTAFRHFTLHTPEELAISYEADGATGNIQVSVSGGVPPYSYLWSNGSAEEDQSGLADGTYTLEVSDQYGCSTGEEIVLLSNETFRLVEYLESGEAGNFANTALPAIKTASSVNTMRVAGKNYIIDIRAEDDYNTGHIEGAVNVSTSLVLDHLEGTDLSSYDEIHIVCYTGMTSSWLTTLVRLAGYDNAFAMKFGMAAWHEDFAGSWNGNISNEYAALFETTDYPKGPAGELPMLTTGLTSAQEILEARIQAVLAEGFSTAAVSKSNVFASLDDYYIVNYWPVADYLDMGHIPGAIQYTPKEDLALDANLKTLPTNKTVAVYAYTGQSEAALAAYLRVLGYDAKAVKFGANAMIYDNMTKSKWSASAIMGYSYVTQ